MPLDNHWCIFIPESIIKSCSEVQIWQSSNKKSPWARLEAPHYRMEWKTPRARQITASKKRDQVIYSTMAILLEAARHQHNTHLVLVMPGSLTPQFITCHAVFDAKRFLLRLGTWSGHSKIQKVKISLTIII